MASAKALAKKLKLHPIFKDYEIILAAGDGKLDDDDENEKSFDKVTKAIAAYDKTITLSVGQLTTGVTIPEWTAVLMLSNMASPALYMQAAFRARIHVCSQILTATPTESRTPMYSTSILPGRLRFSSSLQMTSSRKLPGTKVTLTATNSMSENFSTSSLSTVKMMRAP